MSDVEILLRELIEKVDKLEHKVDNLTKKVKTSINLNYGTGTWGDDSFLNPTELKEIKTPEIFPHPITEDEYKEDSRYAKIEIIYYEEDGVFATFDDKLVEYLDEEYFGLGNLNRLNAYYNVYLRDEKIHVDYHMIYEGCTSYFAEHKGE